MMTKSKTNKQRVLNLKDSLMIFVGILISVFILWYLLKNIDLYLVIKLLKEISIWTISFSLLSILISTIFRAKSWICILNNEVTFKRSYKSINEGMMLNIILPLRMGDIARALFTSNATKIPLLNLIATIVVERIFDVVIMLILLFLSIPFVLFKENIIKTIVIFTLIIIIGIIMVILLIYNVKFLETIWSFIFKKFSSFNQWGRDKITQVSNSLQILKNGKKFLQITFWMILTWTFALLSIWILLNGFFSEVNFVMPIFLQGVSGLGVSIPSSPGSIGVYEATMVFGLSAFGIDESTAFAFGLLHHFLSIVPVMIIGLISLMLDGQNIVGWFSKLQSLREVKR